MYEFLKEYWIYITYIKFGAIIKLQLRSLYVPPSEEREEIMSLILFLEDLQFLHQICKGCINHHFPVHRRALYKED